MALALSGTATTSFANAFTTSFAIATPTNVKDGDTLFIVVNTQVAGTAASIASGGWTLAISTGETGSAVQTYWFWKVWHTGDATSTTVAISGTGSFYGCVCFGYSGADTTTPLGTAVTNLDNVNDTTLNVSTMTTVQNNSVGLISGGINSNATTYSVLPASYTTIAEIGGKRINVCSLSYPISGTSTGALSYTASAACTGATVNVELFGATVVPYNPIAQAHAGRIGPF